MTASTLASPARINITSDNQDAFFDKLRHSLVMLSTSSGDKRVDYRTLFNGLELPKDHEHYGKRQGLDVYFTDIGQLNIAPKKTPEKQGSYKDHAIEKAEIGLEMVDSNESSIRSRLASGHLDNPDSVPLVLMTEDSGWEVSFDHERDPDVERAFLHEVQVLMEERLPADKDWLYNHIDDTFPGPNLKPFQEHLQGGFNELMDIIYTAASRAGMNELRYKSTFEYAFAIHGENEIYSTTFENTGTIIDKARFDAYRDGLDIGEAIDSNAIHVPDGQPNGQAYTMAELGEDAYTTSTKDAPFAFARRDFAEWMQEGIGARAIPEKLSDIHIAYVSPSSFDGGKTPDASLLRLPNKEDYTFVSIPSAEQLRMMPQGRVLNGADMVVLRPEPLVTRDGLIYDPNLMLLDYMGVGSAVDPLSMTTPIILDNRNGEFNHALEVFKDAFQTGRFMGSYPFLVANDTETLQTIIAQQAEILDAGKYVSSKNTIDLVPDDGVLSVFVGGGHANNNERDVSEAHDLGYYLASEGIRIVTGGGQIDGSMGAVHTGFIQYHLDQIDKDSLPAALRESLATFYIDETTGYDAAGLIEKAPELIDQLANARFIPRDMFYAYSTQALIDMESPNDLPPAGTVYQDAGNRIIRLDGLLSAGTQLFLPGGIGTDEELMHALRQRMESVYTANDNGLYSDGTPDAQGKIVIYNRDGQLDGMLSQLGLLHEDGDVAAHVLTRYNIEIVSDLKELKQQVDDRASEAETWLERLRNERNTPRERMIA